MIDLDLRSNKLEKEAQKRRDDAQRKRAKEIQLQRDQVRREQEMAQRAAEKRAEDEKAEMIKQLAEEDERRITGGIRFLHDLKPYQIEGEDDKVILPEDCLTELSQQDVFGRGAVTFQLTLQSSAKHSVTHCGVREFSAPPGTIGIPKTVTDSLGADVSDMSLLNIKYVLLSKCTFAKLQPRHNKFFEVGPVKLFLEQNLQYHTTLTVGDLLTVSYRGKDYELVVTDMKPDSKGSLVDTDVEIDLELSEEFLQHQQQQQQLESSSARTVGRASPSDSATGTGTSTPVPPTPFSTGSTRGDAAASSIRTTSPAMSGVFRSLNESTASVVPLATGIAGSNTHAGTAVSDALTQYLLPEPAPQDKDSVAVKIKLPSGATKMRRFAFASEVRQLFLYVAIEVAQQSGVPVVEADALLHSIQVSTRFPPRTLRFGDVLNGSDASIHKSFVDIGMNVPSEAVFVAIL